MEVLFKDPDNRQVPGEGQSKLLDVGAGLGSWVSAARDALRAHGLVFDARAPHLALLLDAEKKDDVALRDRARHLQGQSIEPLTRLGLMAGGKAIVVYTGSVPGYGETHCTIAFFKGDECHSVDFIRGILAHLGGGGAAGGGAAGGGAAGGGAGGPGLPEGCSEHQTRPFFATIDRYGGDASKKPTVYLRCVCSFRKDGNHVMVSDHNWLAGEDAQMVLSLTDPEGRMATETGSGRPKRGTKLFLTAKVVFYGDRAKAKIAQIERVELRPFKAPDRQEPYFNKETGVKVQDSPLWHGYEPDKK